MSICGKIITGSSSDCDNPVVAGVRDDLILINFDDFEAAVKTENATNKLIIEGIVLGTGITGYKYEGVRNSNVPTYEMEDKGFTTLFKHHVGFKIFKNDGATKDNIEQLAKGRYVAIFENVAKGANGSAAYEILGYDSGLIATVVSRNPTDDATQGAYDIMLENSTASLEPHLPRTLFITDYATTTAVVDSLV